MVALAWVSLGLAGFRKQKRPPMATCANTLLAILSHTVFTILSVNRASDFLFQFRLEVMLCRHPQLPHPGPAAVHQFGNLPVPLVVQVAVHDHLVV